MLRPLSTKLRKQRWVFLNKIIIIFPLNHVFFLNFSLTKDPASYRGSRTGNAANNLELKVLTHIQYVPWNCPLEFQLLDNGLILFFWRKKNFKKFPTKWFIQIAQKSVWLLKSPAAPRTLQPVQNINHRLALPLLRRRIMPGLKMPRIAINGSIIIWCAMNVINLIICILINLCKQNYQLIFVIPPLH